MKKGRLIASTLAGSVISGAYWFAYFWMAYGLTAGDYRPGSEPGAAYLPLKSFLVVVAGPVIYAAGVWVWRRGENRFVGLKRPQ